MPWLVNGRGCFSYDTWSFDHLGDAKEAIRWLKPRYECRVGHYIQDEPSWSNFSARKVYETIEEFIDENKKRFCN